MIDSPALSSNLLLAYTAYLVGTASPGPSNLAIMGVAMKDGCKPALTLAAGVVLGSMTWGLLAAFGLSTVLAAWSGALIVLKILGGIYLLWLAIKAAKSALSRKELPPAAAPAFITGYRQWFLRGAAMHLTNPKAIFVWMTIVSMALPVNASIADALQVVFSCVAIGMLVFGTYALAFATPLARRVYRRLRRIFEGTLALLFGAAGLKMITASPPTP